MKLNKVLSLVVVLVMIFTMSSFAAYSDVKSDASYSEAVDTLSALKILNGYEDGSFKPDGKITRGEFSKVIAGAVGMAESAKANQTGGIFKDVAADLWSSGYIATAYQAGIVNGMGDGTFAPEAEVTYDQAVKMLVAALGYTPKATALGGYPTGYMMVANQEGITVGTANAAGGASRATVARLVYNALTVPMMDQTSFGTDASFEPQEDQSLLYTKLNAIKVDVTISALSFDKTETEVDLVAKDANSFDDVAVANGYDTTAEISPVKINGVDLKGLQGLMVSALIDVSDDSDLKLLAVTKKAGKNKELVIEPSLLSVPQTTDDYVEYFKTSSDDKTSKERLDKTKITYYKNLSAGVATDVKAGGNTGDVSYKYVDTDNDGDYDTVFVTNNTAFVISSVSTSANKIYKDSSSNVASTLVGGSIELDPEDDTVSWSLKDVAGKDLTLADLKAGQVVVVKESNDLESNTFYDIVVSDEVVEGAISEAYSENLAVGTGVDKFYKIGDKAFKLFPSLEKSGTDYALKPGESITAKIADGKIISYKVSAGVRNYALIIETNVDEAFGKIFEVQVMTAKGEVATLELAKKINGGSTDYAGTNFTIDFKKGSLMAYELNSAGEIKNATVDGGISYGDGILDDSDLSFVSITQDYRASTERFGSNYVLDSSVIFAVETAANVAVDKDAVTLASKSILEDEQVYTGSKAVVNADKEIQAVVLFSAGNAIKWDSYPLVITSTATVTVDGESRNKFKGLVNGEEKEYVVAEDKTISYNANDIILFVTNGADEITNAFALATYDQANKKYVVYNNGKVNDTAGVATSTLATDDSKDSITAEKFDISLATTGTAADYNKLATTGTGTGTMKGFVAAGKAYQVNGKILSLINNYGSSFKQDGTTYDRDYGTDFDKLVEPSINPNTIAYKFNNGSSSTKIKVASISELETDKNTEDNNIKDAALTSLNITSDGAIENDDAVFVYGYDGETYLILVVNVSND